jgi:hypothetical protein
MEQKFLQTNPTSQPEHFEPHTDAPKMPPFLRASKRQNSSKSHLFQELENTLIFR